MNRKINNILIIRFRRVGDAVISSCLCSSLKKSFPKANIHYVLNENIAPLFVHHPHIDRIITFSDKDQSSLFRYTAKVKKVMSDTQYDIIIDTRSTIKTLWFSILSPNTPWRIGRLKSYNRFIQNHRVPLGTDHEAANTLQMLTPLEKLYPIIKTEHFTLYPSEEEKAVFAKKMERQGMNLHKPIIICAVAARLEHKMWSISNMRITIERILQHFPSVQLIFNYAGEDEKKHAHAIYHGITDNSRIFINVEASNLREVLAMFSHASFFFGNEGGPRHISQGLNIPGFAIFSPGISKQIWLPSPSERFQGIELPDINTDANKNAHLTHRQKFDLIDTDSVWKRLLPMLKRYLKTS